MPHIFAHVLPCMSDKGSGKGALPTTMSTPIPTPIYPPLTTLWRWWMVDWSYIQIANSGRPETGAEITPPLPPLPLGCGAGGGHDMTLHNVEGTVINRA